MRCRSCAAGATRVADSREAAEGSIIRRRRECPTCKRRFTTFERVEQLTPLIVKKDGRREAFDREKLLRGLEKACEKRPVSVEQLESMVTDIERGLQDVGEKEITSNEIGEAGEERVAARDAVPHAGFAAGC